MVGFEDEPAVGRARVRLRRLRGPSVRVHVAVLAEVLRDAAQLPRARGVAIVGVRAAAEDARRVR